jgi:hypothetical protein
MTTKQKIGIAVGSGLLGAYAVIFVYQRIQRAKADASNVPLDDALKILKEKSSTEIPIFTSEDSIPQVPNPDDSMLDDDEGVNIPDSNLTELQQWDVISGMGDY